MLTFSYGSGPNIIEQLLTLGMLLLPVLFAIAFLTVLLRTRREGRAELLWTLAISVFASIPVAMGLVGSALKAFFFSLGIEIEPDSMIAYFLVVAIWFPTSLLVTFVLSKIFVKSVARLISSSKS